MDFGNPKIARLWVWYGPSVYEWYWIQGNIRIPPWKFNLAILHIKDKVTYPQTYTHPE